MKCRDLMHIDLQWVSGSASAREAARLMRDHSMGFLLISDQSPGHVAGVITDRDLAIRVCAEDKAPGAVKVIDVASTEVIACGEDDELKVVEKRMREEQKSRLVVLSKTGQAVGILSLTDILFGDRPRSAIKTARAVLSREAEGPHTPIEMIKLTPSTAEDEEAVSHQESAMTGRTVSNNVKMFP
jgi:CBS domain-containing protein